MSHVLFVRLCVQTRGCIARECIATESERLYSAAAAVLSAENNISSLTVALNT